MNTNDGMKKCAIEDCYDTAFYWFETGIRFEGNTSLTPDQVVKVCVCKDHVVKMLVADWRVADESK